jgi:hypothetical protein
MKVAQLQHQPCIVFVMILFFIMFCVLEFQHASSPSPWVLVFRPATQATPMYQSELFTHQSPPSEQRLAGAHEKCDKLLQDLPTLDPAMSELVDNGVLFCLHVYIKFTNSIDNDVSVVVVFANQSYNRPNEYTTRAQLFADFVRFSVQLHPQIRSSASAPPFASRLGQHSSAEMMFVGSSTGPLSIASQALYSLQSARFPLITTGMQSNKTGFALLIPDWQFIKTNASRSLRLSTTSPWNSKRIFIAWRGHVDEDCWGTHTKIADLLRQIKLSNVSVIPSELTTDECKKLLNSHSLIASEQSLESQSENTVSLSAVDRHGNSIGLHTKLLSRTLVVKINSDTRNWMSDRLAEWVHFVPVREDLSDLVSQTNWALGAQWEMEIKQSIADAGYELAKSMTLEKEAKLFGQKLLPYVHWDGMRVPSEFHLLYFFFPILLDWNTVGDFKLLTVHSHQPIHFISFPLFLQRNLSDWSTTSAELSKFQVRPTSDSIIVNIVAKNVHSENIPRGGDTFIVEVRSKSMLVRFVATDHNNGTYSTTALVSGFPDEVYQIEVVLAVRTKAADEAKDHEWKRSSSSFEWLQEMVCVFKKLSGGPGTVTVQRSNVSERWGQGWIETTACFQIGRCSGSTESLTFSGTPQTWVWVDHGKSTHLYTRAEVAKCLAGKTVAFVGESIIRSIQAELELFYPELEANHKTTLKYMNPESQPLRNSVLFARRLHEFKETLDAADLVFVEFGLWNLADLYEHWSVRTEVAHPYVEYETSLKQILEISTPEKWRWAKVPTVMLPSTCQPLERIRVDRVMFINEIASAVTRAHNLEEVDFFTPTLSSSVDWFCDPVHWTGRRCKARDNRFMAGAVMLHKCLASVCPRS